MMIAKDAISNTNDDATICKRFAVNLGYWKDPYINLFFGNKFLNRADKKTPEINRGYYARVQSMKYLIDQFLNFVESKNLKNEKNLPEKKLKCQIINIGAGYDTLFWKLHDEKKIDLIHSFVDLDTENVVFKKSYICKSNKKLSDVLEDLTYNESNMHSKIYHLISLDIRNHETLSEKLIKNCNLDITLPTLFISECVFVYIKKVHIDNFLKWITDNFHKSVIANYGQVNMNDRFGQIMMENLELRNCPILDFESCVSLEAQKLKFKNCGFENASSLTMQTIYSTFIDKLDLERIEKIEFLDETNLLEQLLNHYSITVAYKGFDEFFGFVY